MKTRILFVNNDQNVIDRLHSALQPQIDKWDAFYANSGEEALKVLDMQTVDVILTDMKMSGMDGVELLDVVMLRHPKIIRLLISGHAAPSFVIQNSEVAHQIISQNCTPETMITIIERAVGLRQILQDSHLKDTISEMDTLPSLPTLYLEMLHELHSEDPSIRKVGQIVSKDPAMTAKILQLANSAYFSLRRHLSNPVEAVAYLGVDHIQTLVLGYHAFSQFKPHSKIRFSMDLFWEHSYSTAMQAKKIAADEEVPADIINDSFTAGLLHDIGKLMFACRLPDQYAQAVQEAVATRTPLWEVEHKWFSVTHAEVGAYLLGLWGLPESIVESVAYHHAPAQCPNQIFCALTALHAADSKNENRCLAGIVQAQSDTEYLNRLIHTP
jgi:putative nucleotidyltransferase with HDIG domain